MKREPPPPEKGYQAPKGWNGQKVPNPNGSGYGWPGENGNVWMPDVHGGTMQPHWDVQFPGGGYVRVYPPAEY